MILEGEFDPPASEQWYKDAIQKIRDETANKFIDMLGRPEEDKREIKEVKDNSGVPRDCFDIEQ